MTFIEVIAIIILVACFVRLSDRLEELEEENAKNRERIQFLAKAVGELGLIDRSDDVIEFRPMENGQWAD